MSASSFTDLPVPTPANETSNGSSTLDCSPSSGSKTYSEGATASIAVACTVLGALIAGVVVWFLTNHRTRWKRYSRSSTDRRVHRSTRGNSIAIKSLTPSLSSGLDAKLPSPLEESAIARQFSELQTVVRNHVLSFYQRNREKSFASENDDATLAQLLGASSPVTKQRITELISRVETRPPAIRFLLAWSILASIEPTATHGPSILPPELPGCFGAASLSVPNQIDQNLFLSKWRHITGVLLRSKYSRYDMDKDDPRQHSVEELTDTLHMLLERYAQPAESAKRKDSLRQLVKLGAHIGYTLLTQPTGWDFDWRNSDSASSLTELVVFPSLTQLVDYRGQLRPQPEKYGTKKIVSISPADKRLN